jgi:iron complex outermembrane receptor protein
MSNHFKSMLLGASLLSTQTALAADTQLPEVTVIVPGQALRDGQRAGNLATGANGSVMDVPFSVTSVDGDRMRDQAGTTLQDALRNVPGAQADSGFNGSHTQFFILRGAVSDSGTGSNRVLRDGVRLSNYPYVPVPPSACAANLAARSTSSPASR